LLDFAQGRHQGLTLASLVQIDVFFSQTKDHLARSAVKMSTGAI
jgi:hypothetical protein